MVKPIDPAVSEYMSKIGTKGGKRGKGSAKKRGNSEFYKKIRAARSKKKVLT